MSAQERIPPLAACILPIFGIPGSGKTLLTRHLVGSSPGADLRWNLVAVNFDNFYPQDLRFREHLEQSKEEETSTEPFMQKAVRLEVNACLEYLIALNNLGVSSCSSGGMDLPGTDTPSQWERFVSCVCNSCSGRELLDERGRLYHSCRRPTVLFLDDNMPLRSMRYEYYQMARKYQLGFAEVCVQCPISVAIERNSMRRIPIPHSTIEGMEQRMELPDHANYHWERRSVVISSAGDQEQYLKNACQAILPLIEDAFAHPVPPLPEGNPELQESCRITNLESYVHQADQVLRKCVSAILKGYAGGEPKVQLAQQANSIRKCILEELRTGRLLNKQMDSSIKPASAEFRHALEAAFSTLVHNQGFSTQ